MHDRRIDQQDPLRGVIRTLSETLDLLDALGVPPEAGTHLELAIAALRQLPTDPASSAGRGDRSN